MRQALCLRRCVFILTLLLSFQQTFSQPFPAKEKTFDADSIFSKVEIEASFPGGDAAWNSYLSNALEAGTKKFRNRDQGRCRIRFIVDKKGYVTNVMAITNQNSRLAKLAVEIISNSPRWSPAQQAGRFVNAYREQPLSYFITYQ